ncbi:mannose-6-phosphate isomerase class I [Pedobacter sp. CG_S7]|uniref:class I mannose-6-phosphate isomerase n=1 Tax=Pedobacter sp. CG_S7 TaxID=3143930 RepID=UPI0033962756
MKVEVTETIRKTSQELLPLNINQFLQKSQDYTIYPFHPLGDGEIFSGYAALSDWILEQKTVLIDGYSGIIWDSVKAELEREFTVKKLKVNWLETANYLKAEAVLEELINPFLGEPDAVWGMKTSLQLAQLFEINDLKALKPDLAADINIVIGTGAALLDWQAPLIYFDLPKCEVQYRMRSGAIRNLGKMHAEQAERMYKRFYFVDWVILNQHKEAIMDRIVVLVDGQSLGQVNWAMFADIKKGLQKLSKSVFRALPWFAPGAWGGNWLKNHIPDLSQKEFNYAWSFEFIVPENGLVFESDGNLLELSFDFLMFQEYKAVLGEHAERFKTEFPIRFDFLDTFDGGNLSIQCHPSTAYIQKEFGENITQDETYYILDCKEDAKVYLGFQDNIQPSEFKQELEESFYSGKEIAVEKYVQVLPAHKHDLFLIPNGTVHSAGINNLILEISATPYIFTFKMYDWVRPGLDGEPRPINIEHAFKNLNFDRKGDKVVQQLVSKPKVLTEGADWKLIHLPTHEEHFYDIHRIEFASEIVVENFNSCHLLMLVEGTSITVETADGTKMQFNFAETFVIPAAATSYKLINKGKGIAKVVKAFLKTKD